VEIEAVLSSDLRKICSIKECEQRSLVSENGGKSKGRGNPWKIGGAAFCEKGRGSFFKQGSNCSWRSRLEDRVDAQWGQVGRGKNYLAWSRRALWLLKAKRLEGFINGSVVEPKDK
jgi:hypothetical protein